MNFKLEVIIIPVSDVDRAKKFYENLGWRLDADITRGDFHAVQFTPHNSEASIIFGNGVPSPKLGSAQSLVLAVDDINAARADLIGRGVEVSEIFHYAAGPLNNTGSNPRIAGRDPEGRSYYSFASFEDLDGNGWLLQEITTRLPGRVATPLLDAEVKDILISALKKAEAAHGAYEQQLGKRDADWPQWYADHMTKSLSANGYRLTRKSDGEV